MEYSVEVREEICIPVCVIAKLAYCRANEKKCTPKYACCHVG